MSYYGGYEDYYGSELDSLTDEYLEKVREHFIEDVKQLVEDIKTKEKRNTQKESELRERELAIQKQEKEMASLQDKKGEIILEFMKKYGFNLELNQKVYIIESNSEKVECPTCHNNNKIKLQIEGKEFEITCPECRGYGKERKIYKIIPKYVANVKAYFMIFKDKYNHKSNVEVEQCEQYWDSGYETVALSNEPIEDGGCWDTRYKTSQIYLTKEDAEKALEKIKEKEK